MNKGALFSQKGPNGLAQRTAARVVGTSLLLSRNPVKKHTVPPAAEPLSAGAGVRRTYGFSSKITTVAPLCLAIVSNSSLGFSKYSLNRSAPWI